MLFINNSFIIAVIAKTQFGKPIKANIKRVYIMKTLPDQDHLVSDFLSNNGFKYKAIWTGKKLKDGWKYDSWRIVFINTKNGNECAFDYNTGIGHRLECTGYKIPLKFNDYLRSVETVTGVGKAYITESKLDKSIKDILGFTVAILPTQASVLYCLLSDADFGQESFNDFCDNLGYDNDSMQAFKTYQSCMDTTRKISKLFNCVQRQQLADLLQDY